VHDLAPRPPADYLRMAVLALLILAPAAWISRTWRKRLESLPPLRRIQHSILQAGALMLCAMSFGLALNAFAEDGLLTPGATTVPLEQRDRIWNIPLVSIQEVRDASTRPNVVLVDARLPAAYDQGHIPGAVNVPVNLDDDSRRSAVEGVGKDNEVIVYCEDRSCPFSDEIAVRLVADGFSAVKIFRGGWAEWKAANK
jgi:rhodanese-related sulfurtransferase